MTSTDTEGNQSMDEALARLVDERAIEQVQIRYGLSLDSRDWAGLRSCFLPDAVAVYEGLGRSDGYQAIEDICKATLTPLDRSQHLLGNHVVDSLDGDAATARCYFQAQHVKAGTAGGDNYIIAGGYRDRLTRTEDGWRIEHRTLEIWWTDGNAAVVG